MYIEQKYIDTMLRIRHHLYQGFVDLSQAEDCPDKRLKNVFV